MGRTVTILGSTGLIGSHLLRILINDPNTEKINALVRQTTDLHNPELQQFIIDFSDPKAYEPYIAGSAVVFSAVGTTRSEVEGDEEEYRKVDYDINVNAAKAAAKFGVFSYVMVSSAKADPNNNNSFYLKLKGVTEECYPQCTGISEFSKDINEISAENQDSLYALMHLEKPRIIAASLTTTDTAVIFKEDDLALQSAVLQLPASGA